MLAKWNITTFILIIVYIYVLKYYHYNNSNYGKEEKVVALILARGGSKSIKLKNLAIINNTSLLANSIKVIRQCKDLESIWVSTDHFQIEVEARKWGAQIHRRAPYTATDTASSLLAVLEFLKFHPEVGILGLVQVTSPFIKAKYLSSAVEMLKYGNYNSVFSVSRQFKLRWNNYSGEYFPANFNPLDRPRRQDWDGELVENGMFYFAKASDIVKSKSFQTERVGVVEIPQRDSFEIDTPFDLKLAQLMVHESTGLMDAP